MDAPAMFSRKQVPEDVGLRNTASDESGGQGQLHRDEKEHKPVLKKVKDKVKKIKKSLTGHSHSHGDEHGRDEPRADDYDGSSDEEEEGDAALEREAAMEQGGYMDDTEDKTVPMESDPEVHGAPMYESERAPAVQDLVAKYDPAKAPAAREAHGADAPGVRFGDLGGPGFHQPAAQEARGADGFGTRPGFGDLGGNGIHDTAAHGARHTDAPVVRFGDIGGSAEARGADAFGTRPGFGDLGDHGIHDTAAHGVRRDDSPKVRLGDLGGPVVEDPAAPRSRTPAAREGEDIGTTPVIRDFESMTLSDDPSHVGAGKTGARAEEWKDAAADQMGAGESGGATYTDKLKNAAAVPAEYGKKLSSTVYEKVAGVGSVVGVGGGKRDDADERADQAVPVSSDAGVGGEDWKDAPASDAEVTDRSSSGPGYTDKIKSTAAGTTEYGKQLASTVYDKVANVVPAVAPSLRPQVGAGGKPESVEAEERDRAMPVSDVGGVEERKDATFTDAPAADTTDATDGSASGPGYTDKIKSAAAGTTEYGKQLASTVYEKVAGVGTAVVGKVQQATQSAGTVTPGVGAQPQDTAATGQDKGVTMTGYIAEKLRPGDEERSLSSAISGAVQRRKEEVGGTVGQRVPAPTSVITKAREAVSSLTGGTRKSEAVAVQPTTTPEGEDSVAIAATEEPMLHGEETGDRRLNTNTM
ncbi:hypothetical protein EJB05_52675 [Eragrostis curvula]|uniref:Uncharacterized protein n=1 Tax=Eragrostis curvula TaxID=38414 RepID=A0A5J9SS77_9POAL|nr:hypothetical protein EJB05_52675 [Eragrostis curvula]